MEWWRGSIENVAQRAERGPDIKASQPHGVEYQWIDMLIYGVLMMTYRLMAMDVDNEGVWRAPSTKQVESHTGWWEPSPCRIRQWYGRWSKQGRVCHAIRCRGDAYVLTHVKVRGGRGDAIRCCGDAYLHM